MIITKKEQLAELLDFIDCNDILAYDIETTGLNPRKDEIIGFGISSAEDGFYITHKTWENGELKTLLSMEDCQQVLKAIAAKKLLMFNGSFDSRFTRHYFGVDLVDSLYAEVMLLKHTVDEEQPFRLKDIAKKLWGSDAAQEQLEMKESIKANGGNPASDYYMADLEIMGKYCVQDCKLTYRMYDHYLLVLKREGLFKFFFKDEVMPLYRLVTIEMEDRGVPVDVAALEAAKADIEIDIQALEDLIQSAIGPFLGKFNKWYLNKEYSPTKSPALFKQALCKFFELPLPSTKSGKYSVTKKNIEKLEDNIYKQFLLDGSPLPADIIHAVQVQMLSDSGIKYAFNLSSKDHLKRLFFDELDEDPVTRTDKGAPQINDLFLAEMEKKYDWVRDLRNYNKLNKLNGTYISGILEKQEDGIFYPSYFQHRTISGRYGSNLQQLNRPKEKGELDDVVLKYNNMVRKFFVAGDGFKFLDADYESLEPHIFSHVSNDEGLKDIFRKGNDFYSSIAIPTEGLEGVSADKSADNYLGKVNKPLRQKAKAYCLGVPYGLESYALSKQLNVEQREAEILIDNYLNSFPNLKKWMEKSFDDCVTKGFVKSEAGRIRHMSMAPKIWYSHGEDILDSLKLWKKYSDSPAKYTFVF